MDFAMSSLERLVARAQRDVLRVIEELLHFNIRASAGHNDGQESFRQAFNRLCDLRDALMARDPGQEQRWTLYFCRDCGWKGIDSAAHSCVFNAEDRRLGNLPNGVEVLGVEAIEVSADA